MSRGFANAVSPDLGAASAGLADVIELHGRLASFAEVLARATSVAGVTLPFDTTLPMAIQAGASRPIKVRACRLAPGVLSESGSAGRAFDPV
jgi:hypothetical protein